MRNARLGLCCLVACSLLALAGCYESLTSIATADKLVFSDELVGEYKAADPAAGRLTLKKGKDKSYGFLQYDQKGVQTSKGTLWVVKLGKDYFYQVTVDGYATSDGRPVYAIGRLVVEGKAGARTLTGYAFKSEASIFADPKVKTEEYERVENGERRKSRALAMPADKLQEYLAARAAEMTVPTLKYQQSGS
jgi:hypothetical protein